VASSYCKEKTTAPQVRGAVRTTQENRNLLLSRLRLRGSRFLDIVRHQANVHATVLRTTGIGLVRSYRLILPQSDQIKLGGRNAVVLGELLDNRLGAFLAQFVVHIGAADRVGSAGDGQDVVRVLVDLRSEFVKRALRLLRQVRTGEGKVHRRFDHRVIV